MIKIFNKTIKITAKPNKVIAKWGFHRKVYSVDNITVDDLFHYILKDFEDAITSLEILPILLKNCRKYYFIAENFENCKEVNL